MPVPLCAEKQPLRPRGPSRHLPWVLLVAGVLLTVFGSGTLRHLALARAIGPGAVLAHRSRRLRPSATVVVVAAVGVLIVNNIETDPQPPPRAGPSADPDLMDPAGPAPSDSTP